MRKILPLFLILLILMQSLSALTALAADRAFMSIYSRVDNTYILEKTEFEIDENTTVYTLLKQCGVDYKYKNGYVERIAALSEKQHGKDSGWVFTVDGKRINVGANSRKVNAGEFVEWIYVVGDTSKTATTTQTPPTISPRPTSAPMAMPSADPMPKPEPEQALPEQEETEQALPEIPAVQSIVSVADTQVSMPPVDSPPSTTAQPPAEQTTSADESADGHPFGYSTLAIAASLYLCDNTGAWSAIPIWRSRVTRKNSALKFDENSDKLADLERELIIKSEIYNLSEAELDAMMEKIMQHPDLYDSTDNLLIFAVMAAGKAKRVQYYDELVSALIKRQNQDGGFTLKAGEKSDIDLTAMAVRAIQATGINSRGLQEHYGRAVDWLARQINEDGSFGNPANCESTAQALMALSAEVNYPEDLVLKTADALEKFAKYDERNSETIVSFSHLIGGESDIIATEQAAQALLECCDSRFGIPYNKEKIALTKSYTTEIAGCIVAVILIVAGALALKLYRDKKKGEKQIAK